MSDARYRYLVEHQESSVFFCKELNHSAFHDIADAIMNFRIDCWFPIDEDDHLFGSMQDAEAFANGQDWKIEVVKSDDGY